MNPLPLPFRVVAGLAVTAVEQARKLPKSLAGLPVTVASVAMQVSMRAQQRVTELAIKGDEILSTLRPAEESPEWATFDEDNDREPPKPPSRAAAARLSTVDTVRTVDTSVDDAVDDEPAPADRVPPAKSLSRQGSKVAVPAYDDLTLPQVRARMRRLSVEQLGQLLEYERTHAGREEFVRMLSRRIATISKS